MCELVLATSETRTQEPVVSAKGSIAGIGMQHVVRRLPDHALNENIHLREHRDQELPTAVILAGGLGMRLRPAFATGPKSLAPVGGRPFVDYVLKWLSACGVKDVILCVGYKGAQIQEYVGTGKPWGVRARYSVEKKLLGTGGALKQAEGLVSSDCAFVMNGDTYLDVNLRKMLAFHRGRKTLVTTAAVRVVDSGRYGSLELDEESRIIAFHEKGGASECCGARGQTHSTYINGGVYVVDEECLEMIPQGREISLEREVFPDLAARRRIFGFATNGYFLDIGMQDDYNRAQIELPERFSNSYSH